MGMLAGLHLLGVVGWWWLVGTCSRRSFNCDSRRSSSSVGFGGGLLSEANCAYVWKMFSVCLELLVSSDLGWVGLGWVELALDS